MPQSAIPFRPTEADASLSSRALIPWLLCLGAALMTLQSCAPVLVVGGVSALSLAVQDQGLPGAVTDKEIKLHLKGDLFGQEEGLDLYNRVDVNVFEGNVLFTGYVATEETKVKVTDMAENTNGVRAIYNELNIGEEQGLGSASYDTWISTRIRADLFFTHDIRSANFLVHTTDGVVYLIGVAQSQAELDQVLDIIKATSGVKKVVDITRLADEPLPPPREITQKSYQEKIKEAGAKTPVEKRYGGSQNATYPITGPHAPQGGTTDAIEAVPLDDPTLK